MRVSESYTLKNPSNKSEKEKQNIKQQQVQKNESNFTGKHEIGNTRKKRVAVLIVGNSQLRELGEERMSNDCHYFEKRFRPGMKIREGIEQTGKTNNDVIIVYTLTNNFSKATPQDLIIEVVATVD